MANYYGSARSNYFKVKDVVAFKEALVQVDGIEIEGDNDNGYTILVLSDSGGWPSSFWDEDSNEDIEIDIPTIVSEHLQDGEVGIFMEAGAEKLRYLVGYAEAINNKGEREFISLTDIYELAAQRLTDNSENITKAEY